MLPADQFFAGKTTTRLIFWNHQGKILTEGRPLVEDLYGVNFQNHPGKILTGSPVRGAAGS
jgi:hypothetical protein